MKCLNCNIETENPKFCSRSCAAKKNNKVSPKRKPEHTCKSCAAPVTARRWYCNDCAPKSMEDKTLGEYRRGNANSYGYPAIRGHSRKKYIKSGLEMSCFICGYSYHVDICHIKDINKFPDSALISEVNAITNLVALCKNHHYEFDCGDLHI